MKKSTAAKYYWFQYTAVRIQREKYLKMVKQGILPDSIRRKK